MFGWWDSLGHLGRLGRIFFVFVVLPAWAAMAFMAAYKICEEPVANFLNLVGIIEKKEKMGTLRILARSWAEGYSNRCWIYLDGCIIAKEESRPHLSVDGMLVTPGKHKIEFALERRFIDSQFPFHFAKQEADITAGNGGQIVIDAGSLTRLWFTWGPDIDILWGPTGSLENWWHKLVKRVKDCEAKYLKDPVVIEIYEIYNLFQKQKPGRPYVYINVPETYGGPREFDAYQVGRLVSWLNPGLFGGKTKKCMFFRSTP